MGSSQETEKQPAPKSKHLAFLLSQQERKGPREAGTKLSNWGEEGLGVGQGRKKEVCGVAEVSTLGLGPGPYPLASLQWALSLGLVEGGRTSGRGS